MGKLIVIEGLDGSGKSTQSQLVLKKMQEKGEKVRLISFPDYNNPSSTLVKMYLNGEFSKNADDVNAYAASSFYAVDRYSSYILDWKKDYEAGYTIIASRYVDSNAIHQMSKLPENKWDNYLEWLYDYEYNKLSIPKPNRVIFLDMPRQVADKLLLLRYSGDENKKDIHEENVEYLKRCEKTSSYASKKFCWDVIKCADDSGNPLSKEKITNDILNKIEND